MHIWFRLYSHGNLQLLIDELQKYVNKNDVGIAKVKVIMCVS